ncbi:MAG: hypothetical protein ACOC2V_04170 [Alkalispirochaeta sp.]
MSSIPINLRDQLIEHLKVIETRTADIFMALAESLPALVKEMKESLDQSRDAIACMAESGQGGCSDGIRVTSLVEQIRTEMEQSVEQFQDMSRRDNALFTQLQHGIDQLEGISTAIAAIREDSEDMELVSLNAMTVALKAGNAGRAFSYITEELKRLANRTIALSEEISRKGADLIENFRNLEASLNDARQFQDDLVAGVRTRIASGLHELEGAVRRTVSDLRELREESMELQEPLNGMMEAIQLQDLIRQSIDHIILSLNAIRPEDQLEGPTALLDELAFSRKIPALATRLIEDVAEQIDGSVETFLELTAEAEQRLGELQTAQRSFLANNIDTGVGRTDRDGSIGTDSRTGTDTDTDEGMSLEERFQHASRMLQTLLEDLQRSVQKKEALVGRSGAITAQVEELEARFRTFTTLVTRFRSIDIASRIEVAKQEVLRRMGTSAEQMTALTRTIEEDVNRSLESTQEFIKSTSTIIDRHHAHFAAETRFVNDFSESIRTRYTALSHSRENVVRVVGGFSLFTDGFLRVFRTSKENGRQLASLADQIRSLTSNLESMQTAIDERYTEELERQELDSWTIENDRLREIIERFTIFTHKQHAGDLVGFDVETGVEAGDVTLF